MASALFACSLDESGLSPGDAGFVDVGIDVRDDVSPPVDSGSDAPADVVLDVQPDVPPPPPCNPTSAFGSFVDLSGINSGASEVQPTLTSDELTMFFGRSTSGPHVSIFYATRTSIAQPFGGVSEAMTVSVGNGYDSAPFIGDGLTLLYFDSIRNATSKSHLYQATGNGTPDAWTAVMPVTAVNSANDSAQDIHPFWVASTSELWFSSDRLGSFDLYVSAGSTSPPAIATVNSTFADVRPSLSRDGLTLFFARSDTNGIFHIWATTRANAILPFGIPLQLTEFDSGNANVLPGWISDDGCRMYFDTDRSGGKGSYDLWMATRGP